MFSSARAALHLRQVAEETGASVLLSHYAPKHLAGKPGQTPRGAGSLAGGVGTVANAVEHDGKLVIGQTKNRDAKPMTLRMQMTFTGTSFMLERLVDEVPPCWQLTWLAAHMQLPIDRSVWDLIARVYNCLPWRRTGNGDYPGGCYVVCVSGQSGPRRNELPCCEYTRNRSSGRYGRMRISFSRKRGNPSAAYAEGTDCRYDSESS